MELPKLNTCKSKVFYSRVHTNMQYMVKNISPDALLEKLSRWD